MNGEELVLVMSIFLITGGVIWKWIDSSHKQRMAIIEKGVSAEDLVGLRRVGDPLTSLKWGLLGLFVGAGLLLGIILNTNFNVVDEATPALGLLMGGGALLVYYRIASGKR